MTAKKTSICTDEELLDELKKLGYSDVSPNVLEIMKDDLSQLISNDRHHHPKPVESTPGIQSSDDSNTFKHRYLQKHFQRAARNLTSEKPLSSNVANDFKKNYSYAMRSKEEISKTGSIEKYRNTLTNYRIGNYRKQENLTVDNIQKLYTAISHDSSSEVQSVADEQYKSNEKESCLDSKHSSSQRQIPKLQRKFSDSNKSPLSEISFDNKFSDGFSSEDVSRVSAFDRNKNTFLSYKSEYAKKHENVSADKLRKQESLLESNENTISKADYQSSLSSISQDPNKIKRKVLRHRNGKPVITEEFLDIPSIFNSSYPETQTLDSNKSFSSDDLSWKSNSSTGSISAVSPDTSTTPRSMLSLSSTRTFNSRFGNPRKKKNDPVAMYNYYKKFWNEFKPPGEKTHDKIRWAVRDKMLDYNL